MPKISELTAGTTLVGNELIPAVQSGVTSRITPDQLATYVSTISPISTLSGIYNIRDYGAVGDGATNDTVAINAAIAAAGAAGGGTVYVPTGTYIIRPATISTQYALHVAYDNIRIVGDGWPGGSHLKFLLYNGTDPDAAWPLVSGAVQRGWGIQIESQTGFRMAGIELDGSASSTGDASFPASIVDGDGWDVTHKGIYFVVNVAQTDIVIRDCYIHGWRGEIVYYGGSLLDYIRIVDCRIGVTNADGISMSASNMEVRDCEIYSCVNAGIENAYFTGRNVYANNYIHDTPQGAAIYPALDGVQQGFVDIRDNHFKTCSGQALYIQGASNMRVYNNYIIDCGYGIYLHNHGTGGSATETIYADNVQIYGNVMAIDTVTSTGAGIYMEYTGAETMKKILIQDNITNVTAWGETNAKTARAGIEMVQPIRHGTGQDDVRVSDNYAYTNNLGSSLDDTWIDETLDKLLADTALNSILTIADDRDYLRTFDVFYEVKTAATTLALNIKFYDDSGSEQTINWISGSQNVGVYSASYNISPHYGSNDNTKNLLKLQATAGTANQITISARVRD